MRALLVTALSEAILTMYPGPFGRSRTRKGKVKRRASRGLGAKLGSKANTCESVINLVMTNMPKMLTGMDQKVCGWSLVFNLPKRGQMIPPGKSWRLTFQCHLHGTR